MNERTKKIFYGIAIGVILANIALLLLVTKALSMKGDDGKQTTPAGQTVTTQNVQGDDGRH